MFSIVLFSLLFIFEVTSTVQKAQWGSRRRPAQGHHPKTYKINLEDDYKQRWSQLMTENKRDINILADMAMKIYAAEGTQEITYINLQLYNIEFAKEIRAVAELLDTSVNKVFWLNVMYEAYAYCTSIVVQDDEDFIFHGRNLDYGFTRQIANIAFQIDYYKKGEIFFRANVLGGFIGFITAEKPGKFSISANQRSSPYIKKSGLFDAILGRGTTFLEMFLNKKRGPLMTIRSLMETAESYEDAINILGNQTITAPIYYIVSGVKKNEGAVLTMSRDGLVNITKLDVDNGVWFLAQTNYDRNLPDPISDNRRAVAEERMTAIGRSKIDMQNLLDGVLALYPNNNAATILSAVYSSGNDYFNVTLWV